MTDASAGQKKRIVFLGTPQVAARALEILLDEGEGFDVLLVVSQPPARAPRGNGTVPSPVHALATSRNIEVVTPESARDEVFLQMLEKLQPDLCITAAYGNVLPERFLAIPKFGTLNIHPSLLPLYRGAAPVQRAVEDGVSETGVTILYTVKAMDAGPVVFQERTKLDLQTKAPELLAQLFERGAHLLVEGLPRFFERKVNAVEQDASKATHAKKLSPEEGKLDFNDGALKLHNKVRAFAGWPGTRALFEYDGARQEVKVLTTRAGTDERSPRKEIALEKDALVAVCGDGRALEIVELQAPGKRAMAARDFWNGLKTKRVEWAPW